MSENLGETWNNHEKGAAQEQISRHTLTLVGNKMLMDGKFSDWVGNAQLPPQHDKFRYLGPDRGLDVMVGRKEDEKKIVHLGPNDVIELESGYTQKFVIFSMRRQTLCLRSDFQRWWGGE